MEQPGRYRTEQGCADRPETAGAHHQQICLCGVLGNRSAGPTVDEGEANIDLAGSLAGSLAADRLSGQILESLLGRFAVFGEGELVGAEQAIGVVSQTAMQSIVEPESAKSTAQRRASMALSEPSKATTIWRGRAVGAVIGITATGMGEWVAHCVLVEPSASRAKPPRPRVPTTSSELCRAAPSSTVDAPPEPTLVVIGMLSDGVRCSASSLTAATADPSSDS